MRIRLAVAAIPLACSALFLAGCAEKPTAPLVATRPALTADASLGTILGYSQVAAALLSTCGLRTDGSLTCWGENQYGLLDAPAGTNFAQVSSTIFTACAVKTDHSVACWGWNGWGQATPPATTDFAQVAAGGAHTCALRTDGSLVCWGGNYSGQLDAPVGNDFTRLSAGNDYTCALKKNASLVCWGDNTWGQAIPPVGAYVSVGTGLGTSCAVRTDGSLACWGRNDFGEAVPPTGTDFAHVSVGGWHACALKTDHSVICWGYDGYGQLDAPAEADFVQLSAGGYHNCAVRTDGSLTCWGDNEYGQATPPPLPVTPQAATQLLMDDVRTLVTQGVLSEDQGDGLLAKLAAAIPSLNRGSTKAACNQLQAFVNQVSGLVWAKQLSAAAGQELTDAAEAIRSQVGCATALCPAPAQGNSVLVDASRDGGGWWSPQAGPFSPESEHQGQALADYLRGKGYVVQELARGITITDSLLLAAKIVIRANVFGSYTSAELQAYQHFLACSRTLLLLGDYSSDGDQDQLAEMLGVKFTGLVYGYVATFAAHPITSGVVPLFYNAGAVVEAGYPNTVHILGWLSTGEPVMGVVDHGAAKVFFIGDMNGIESVPQPLVDNLINWGF